MKISWGIKIIIVFSLFAAGIISMVIVSMKNNTELVSENYYDQEIRYQDHIDKLKSSSELSESISIFQEDGNIIIKTMDLLPANKYSGEISFYRSSDARQDFIIPFDLDEKGIQRIDITNIDRGAWKVNMDLKNSGKDFFISKNIYIN